tara:strand:+ start:2780 stop:3547 length:768 start_codon:yes stop_codon:yes gene_type:complete
MKVVILAGGLGTRISEETHLKPKPMVEIGGIPIIHHLMKIYSHYGLNEFIICLGYKGYLIKEYFINSYVHNSDLTVDLKTNEINFHNVKAEPWKVSLINTGMNTMTGGRLLRIKDYLKNETFCMTYGDGLASIDIKKLIDFHKNNGKLATLTAVQPPGRFGSLVISNNFVTNFSEKPQGEGGWINGGFFVLEPGIFDYIDNDLTVWEKSPLNNLAKKNKLTAYFHKGFWQPMDTLRDKKLLENLWVKENPPWKIW